MNILKKDSKVIERLDIFYSNKEFNWDILTSVGTFHLNDPVILKTKLNQFFLSLEDINYITDYRKGLIHFELSGNICIQNRDSLMFNIIKENSNWDFDSKRPNTDITFNSSDLGVNKIQGFWHLHPWNSMNKYDVDNINLSNFFSIQDIDAVFTYPKHLFVIFNMKSPNQLQYPCIYILMFHPELINFKEKPIFWKKAILEYQRILVPFILDKMEKQDDKIDWENIKKTFLSLGITFDYLNDYDNDIFVEKINLMTKDLELPNC